MTKKYWIESFNNKAYCRSDYLDTLPSDDELAKRLVGGVTEINLFEVDENDIKPGESPTENNSTFLRTLKKEGRSYSVWISVSDT